VSWLRDEATTGGGGGVMANWLSVTPDDAVGDKKRNALPTINIA